MNLRRSSSIVPALHGINTPSPKAKSVTHVSGTFCYLSLKSGTAPLVSTWLVDHARVGDLVDVQIPRGRFFKVPDEPVHVVMLAAGSGIAPILSIARWLLENDHRHQVTLVYGNRTPDTVILADEVEDLAASFPGHCVLEHVMSHAGDDWQGPRGRIETLHPGPVSRLGRPLAGPCHDLLNVRAGRFHGHSRLSAMLCIACRPVDRVRLELLLGWFIPFDLRQSTYAMTLQAPMER